MRIVCPTCEASYTVPDAVVAAMRPVQCARCKNEWVPGAEPEAEAEVPAEAPAPEVVPPPEVAEVPAEEPAAAPAEAGAPPAPEPEPEPELEPAAPAPQSIESVAPVAPPAPLVASPIPPAPVAVRPVMPQPAAPRPDAALRAPAPTTPAQPVLAWVASIVLILAFIGAGVAFRNGVMKAWPPSTRLYAALGLLK